MHLSFRNQSKYFDNCPSSCLTLTYLREVTMSQFFLIPYVGRNTLPSEFGRTEPNRHIISNSHNFHPTQTRRFPLCTNLPRDLNQGIIKTNYKKIIVLLV